LRLPPENHCGDEYRRHVLSIRWQGVPGGTF
jgi:hypothetical protein